MWFRVFSCFRFCSVLRSVEFLWCGRENKIWIGRAVLGLVLDRDIRYVFFDRF